MVTVWEMGIWPHSMCGAWCHLHQCFSPEERFLLCNRCLIEDTCQSGHVSCYHPLYATGRHYMCRNAATWKWSHSTKNIKNKKLLLGGFFVLFFCFVLFFPERKERKQFLLSLSIWEHQRRTPPCSLSWGWDPSPDSILAQLLLQPQNQAQAWGWFCS